MTPRQFKHLTYYSNSYFVIIQPMILKRTDILCYILSFTYQKCNLLRGLNLWTTILIFKAHSNVFNIINKILKSHAGIHKNNLLLLTIVLIITLPSIVYKYINLERLKLYIYYYNYKYITNPAYIHKNNNNRNLFYTITIK